jgi:hypothetical protein
MSERLQRVWLILTKVRVLLADNPAGLTIGSEALVQCFVPETILEVGLTEVDRLLRQEGMRRVDVLKCVSFDEEIGADDDVPDFLRKDVDRARRSGKALTGTFFTSQDSASFQSDKLEGE